MKRALYSSSFPTSLSNSEISLVDIEPASKRSRIFVSSPLPDNENQTEEEEEEIIIDETLASPVILNEDSRNEFYNDDDIIEIEQQNINVMTEQTANQVIIVSDSDSDDDDQGIDVTDDISPSVSSIINTSLASFDIEDVEIVQGEVDEELELIDEQEEEEEEEQQQQQHYQLTNDNDLESLEILINDDDNISSNELIDLTEDELKSFSCSPNLFERKPSIDVQQCPICLETLSHLQQAGVYLIITPCYHVMCTSCIRQLLATSSRCPLCRENVSATTLMPYCILT